MDLEVPKFVIERAVLHLDKIEALALIRGAFGATLQEAHEIHAGILGRVPVVELPATAGR